MHWFSSLKEPDKNPYNLSEKCLVTPPRTFQAETLLFENWLCFVDNEWYGRVSREWTAINITKKWKNPRNVLFFLEAKNSSQYTYHTHYRFLNVFLNKCERHYLISYLNCALKEDLVSWNAKRQQFECKYSSQRFLRIFFLK